MSLNNLFTTSALTYPEIVEVPGILNTHTHPRDTEEEGDGRAEMLIPLMAEVYEDVLGMGNTKVPLTNAFKAISKGAQWYSLIPAKKNMRVHVAGMMIESTNPDEVVEGYDQPDGKEAWLAIKMFLRSVSNSGGADVDDVSKIIPVIKAMTDTSRFKYKKRPMALPIHTERKFTIHGQRINFLHRERAAVERDIAYIFKEVPEAHIIICHVSDASTIDAIRYYRSKGFNIWGEIAPQYTMWTCDDLFEGPDGGTAFDAHKFCLPIFKTEADRRAIEAAMLSGEDFWIFGSDEACHWDDPKKPVRVKVSNKGYVVGGQTQIPKAVVSYVIEKFAEAGKLESLSGFLSHNGREALGLPRSTTIMRFKRYDWIVEEEICRESPRLGKLKARVAMAGQLRRYLPEAELAV